VRWLPVLLAKDDNYATIRDTFRVQNGCIGNVALKSWPGSPTAGFTFPKIVAPKSTQPVFFEKMKAIGPDGIATYEDFFSIETGAGYAKTLSLRYFIAGKNTAVVDPNTGRIVKYREQSTDKFTAFELITDENGMPAARGNVLAKSGIRVGQWHFMNPNTPLMPDTVYSKRFILLLGKDWSDGLVPEIREKDQWLVPEFFPVHEGFQFYCTPATDSIRVRAGDRMADMAYDYQRTEPNGGGQLWLLKPGESHYFNGSAKVPLVYSDYQYVITWNYEELKKTNTQPMDLTDEIAALGKKYPQVTFTPYLHYPGYYQVNTGALSSRDRESLLKKLESNPIILRLGRIVYPGALGSPTYGDNSIGVVFHNDVVPSHFVETLAKYGFKQMNPQTGSSHYYQVTYENGRFDQEMIDAANALAREKGIKSVGLNFYIRIEADLMREDVKFPHEPKW